MGHTCLLSFFSIAQQPPDRPGLPHYLGYTIILRHTTFSRTALDGWSVRRSDPYLTTQNTHNRQTSMTPTEFEPAIPASERPQTQAIDSAATEIGCQLTFIHSAFCLTTGPKPPPKRFLQTVRFRASSFKWEYLLLSLRSSSSFLRLLPRLLVTSISPFIFPSISLF